MKKIKILLLLLTISASVFYSCSDNNPVENEAAALKSIALRSTLNYLKNAENPAGKDTVSTEDQALCFNFVYPITLEYNNGTQITVANFEGLLEIIVNENNNLYIDGIIFPFQVQEERTITTINNEAEFFALLQQCTNIQTVNDFVFDFACYSIVFPIQIINANNETVTITTLAELMEYVSFAGGAAAYQLNLVFPFSVVQDNQTIVINDLYEFFELNNDCGTSDCICMEIYDPVCVLTPDGAVVQYSNACFAACDGYDQTDFVDCASSCLCPTNFDPVCVQTTAGVVQYDNACRAECDGFTSADFITCGVAPLPTFGQNLGTCFQISFPVQIQWQGALVTANNNGEVLQYWNPTQSGYPAFNYPITVTFSNGITAAVANQSAFQSLVAQHCN